MSNLNEPKSSTLIAPDSSTLSSKKPARFRSVAYPSNAIQHCVDLTTQIYKSFGNVYATRDRIAKAVQQNENTLQTQLSSCVQYGLLELKPVEGYKTTPLHTRIYATLPTERKEDALLEAFSHPELYKKVIKENNNKILTPNGLSIILFRNYKVAEIASKIAAKIFFENATALGLVNAYGLFSVDKGIAQESEPTEVVEEHRPPNNNSQQQEQAEVIYLPPSSNDKSNKKFDSPPIPIFMDDGSVAELYLPKGFNKPDIERVIKVLRAQVE